MKDNELIGGVENSVPESKTKAVKDENIKDEQRAKILSIAVHCGCSAYYLVYDGYCVHHILFLFIFSTIF